MLPLLQKGLLLTSFLLKFLLYLVCLERFFSDNGPQFISNLVQGVMEKYKIQHRKYTPYHP